MSIEDIELPEEGMNEEEASQEGAEEATVETAPGKFDKLLGEHSRKYKLSGMFKDWFLDYSSYVILYRAVPHIVDGLKPVQRRVLHAMYKKDTGAYTKVATLVGAAMEYHPHGDASVYDHTANDEVDGTHDHYPCRELYYLYLVCLRLLHDNIIRRE